MNANEPADDDSLDGDEKASNLVNAEDEQVENKEQFKQLLQSKNKEIEKLKVLIEALEPIPGLDPNKYKEFVVSDIDDAFDFRDSKITSLAKKIRNLTMKLNKSNALNEKYRNDQEILTQRYDQVQQSLDTMKKEDRSNALANRSEVEIRLQKELNIANKSIDELKRKQSQLNDEIKNLQRLLRSELGENTTIEQAMDPSWKGRARQIELLKIKLKKYERSGLFSGTSVLDGVSTMGGGSVLGGLPAVSSQYQPNGSVAASVDTRAMGDLLSKPDYSYTLL